MGFWDADPKEEFVDKLPSKVAKRIADMKGYDYEDAEDAKEEITERMSLSAIKKSVRMAKLQEGRANYNKKLQNKRSLTIREKQILYEKAKHRCEVCRKLLTFSDMQVGHKRAASKGGRATLRNSACLCYSCNRLQGTDDFATFKRKMGR